MVSGFVTSPARPRADLLGGREADLDRVEVVDVDQEIP
jgi:hypothetical protein